MTTDWFGEDHQPPKVWTIADIYKDLTSTAEISQILNVNKHRVHAWILRRDNIGCPKPIRVWPRFDLYSGEEWKLWFARFQAKRRPGTKWTTEALPYGTGEPFFRQFDEY